ncbi:hypothetical protein L249_7602 [Ophiocordyceps polyrhachis-furcata BCC 54312]|uniref:Uncharacterized protein n=1 Tax=Ophiocordyceps polyrhachis-furcata BCC 54312 TaxID=1330021 RepID=A0A367LAA7_9HYPO|nr:hypothetical protein L249_7602 [Ophiocordyceps polyrhachis-furcata BCC 54312]
MGTMVLTAALALIWRMVLLALLFQHESSSLDFSSHGFFSSLTVVLTSPVVRKEEEKRKGKKKRKETRLPAAGKGSFNTASWDVAARESVEEKKKWLDKGGGGQSAADDHRPPFSVARAVRKLSVPSSGGGEKDRRTIERSRGRGKKQQSITITITITITIITTSREIISHSVKAPT